MSEREAVSQAERLPTGNQGPPQPQPWNRGQRTQIPSLGCGYNTLSQETTQYVLAQRFPPKRIAGGGDGFAFDHKFVSTTHEARKFFRSKVSAKATAGGAGLQFAHRTLQKIDFTTASRTLVLILSRHFATYELDFKKADLLEEIERRVAANQDVTVLTGNRIVSSVLLGCGLIVKVRLDETSRAKERALSSSLKATLRTLNAGGSISLSTTAELTAIQRALKISVSVRSYGSDRAIFAADKLSDIPGLLRDFKRHFATNTQEGDEVAVGLSKYSAFHGVQYSIDTSSIDKRIAAARTTDEEIERIEDTQGRLASIAQGPRFSVKDRAQAARFLAKNEGRLSLLRAWRERVNLGTTGRATQPKPGGLPAGFQFYPVKTEGAPALGKKWKPSSSSRLKLVGQVPNDNGWQYAITITGKGRISDHKTCRYLGADGTPAAWVTLGVGNSKQRLEYCGSPILVSPGTRVWVSNVPKLRSCDKDPLVVRFVPLYERSPR